METRLRMIVPYLSTWPQAMAVQTLPQNAVESWTNLANLCDEIWYYAGDRSVDVSEMNMTFNTYGGVCLTEIARLRMYYFVLPVLCVF